MATLLELQELFRNISDPEVDELLRSSPKETRWMVMDEKRRRAEMREAEKAAKSESQIKPRNMLEEYQANTSSVLGGQPLGDIGQPDQGQYGAMDSSGGPDPYAGQQGGVQGYSLGGLIPLAVGAGQMLWPFRHQVARTVLPKSMYGKLFPKVVEESMRLPARAGAGTGRSVLTPQAAAAARAEGEALNAAMSGVGRKQLGKAALKASPALGLGAVMLADDGVGEDGSDAFENARRLDPDASQGTSQYENLLKRIMDRDDELQERVGDARISREDKIRRIGLAASAAMMSTPGGFGRGVGAAFGAAGQEIGAINQEEDAMLRNAVYEYQVGSASSTDLLRAIAAINSSMSSGGRGGMTDSMLVKLLQEYGLPNIPEFLNDLNRARAMVYGQGQAVQTDYDHRTPGSAYGTD